MKKVKTVELKMNRLGLKQVKINDPFWSKWQTLVREAIIPYQWDALNDHIPEDEPSHTIDNFKIAARRREGKHYGMVFQDSDLYKWMETVGFALATQKDDKWEQIMDDVIDLLEQAQEKDGYLNTSFSVNEFSWAN